MKTLILAIVIILQCKYSYGCDCDKIIGIKESKIVFEGIVTSIVEVDSPYVGYDITFKVSKTMKGKVKYKTIVVRERALLPGGCGIPFEIGIKYQVYAYDKYNMLYTNSCTSTKRLI